MPSPNTSWAASRNRSCQPRPPRSWAGWPTPLVCPERRASMPPRSVQLLHVEDDAFQRHLLAHQLARLPDHAFAITYAESEDEAIVAFHRGRTDCVILDYHLAQGNGLN